MAFTVSLDDLVGRNQNGLLSVHPSWERVRLGDVASVLNGFAFPSSDFSNQPGVPLLRIRDVLRDRTEAFFTGVYDDRYLTYPGELVIGMDGDFNCALWQGPPALLNQRVCKVTVRDDCYDLRFLQYVLPGYLSAINSETSSITVKHLSSRTVEDIPLPLPPLPEQQRIVAAIEEQFTRLDAAVAGLKRTQANLKRYRAAVLTAACSGRLVPTEAELARQEGRDYEPADQLLKRILTERRERWESGQLAKMQAQGKVPGQRSATGKYREPTGPEAPVPTSMPEGWEWATIDQLLVSDLSNGRSVPDMAGGFPVLRLTALKNGRIDLSQRKAGAWTRDDAAPFLVKHGDFLVSRGNGSLSLVGRGGIVDIEPDGVAYPDTLIRVRTSERGIDPKYLESVWNSRIVRRQIEAVARTTAGIYKINQRDLKQIVIPVPPVVEQQRIVGEIERHWSVLDSLEDSTANALIRAGRLRQSILSRAFEGRLVPQDPTDEPAEALLERIRAERAANLSKGRQRRHGAHKTAQQPLFDLQEVGETE